MEEKISTVYEYLASILIIVSILVLGIVYSYHPTVMKRGYQGLILYYGVPVLGIISLSFSFFLSSEAKSNLFLLLISLGLTFYGIESFFWFQKEESIFLDEFDTRSKLEVIEDLRESGTEAYPVIRPVNVRKLPEQFSSGFIRPLGGIPNAKIVFCQIRGEWITYSSDRFGFNNPQLEKESLNPTIMGVGDSFLHGTCVPQDETFGGVLREKTEGGVRMFGLGGNGPLTEYATFIEYIKPFEPPIVLWFFYEGNDLKNLRNEKKDPILMRYLREDTYSRNLIAKQDLIGAQLRNYAAWLIRKRRQKEESVDWLTILRDLRFTSPVRFLTLESLRYRIGLTVSVRNNEKSNSGNLNLFREILLETKREVGEWGGELYLVYLPERARFNSPEYANPHRKEVFDLCDDLGIEVIDGEQSFRGNRPNSLFEGHYTPEGYRLISQSIYNKLSQEAGTSQVNQ